MRFRQKPNLKWQTLSLQNPEDCFCFNNVLYSPFLRVRFRQKPNLKWQTLSLQNPEDCFCFNNVLYSPFLRVMLCQISDPKK